MSGEATLRDPVGTAVLANRLNAIGHEMANTLQRTARSSVINQAKDLSCAVVTADNRLITAADGLPVFLIGTETICRTMTELIPDLAPGDVFLHNDPYLGNTHHADFTFVAPVFWQGRRVFSVAAKAHQADCGNVEPTTYMPSAQDVYHEGSLNFPCVRIQRGYEDVTDIVRMIRSRIRVPDIWYGDYLAAIGAVRVGERRLVELLDRVGLARVEEFLDEWFDYSERLMADQLRRFPHGTWSGETWHDPIPGVCDAIPIRITISVDAEAGRAVFDLTDNVDCIDAGMNLSEATATNSPIAGMLNALPESVPINWGSLRRLEVKLRRNCIVGIPEPPHSCSVATNHFADRVICLTQRVLAEAADGLGLAEGGMGMGPGVGVISGSDDRTGPYQAQMILGVGGGPAGPGFDGWEMNYLNPPCAGVVQKDSIEMDELTFPLIVWEQRLCPDTEGPGRFRGSPGTLARFGPRSGSMLVHYLLDAHDFPPQGVRGGGSGGPSRAFRIGADGARTELPLVDGTLIRAGEQIESIGSGGGGYGPARERAVAAVLADVRGGLVSPERAAAVYGVAVRPAGGALELDPERTASLRAALAADAGRDADTAGA